MYGQLYGHLKPSLFSGGFSLLLQPMNAEELAKTVGKNVRSVYRLAKKLGRLPTVAELKAVKRGAPKKYK